MSRNVFGLSHFSCRVSIIRNAPSKTAAAIATKASHQFFGRFEFALLFENYFGTVCSCPLVFRESAGNIHGPIFVLSLCPLFFYRINKGAL